MFPEGMGTIWRYSYVYLCKVNGLFYYPDSLDITYGMVRPIYVRLIPGKHGYHLGYCQTYPCQACTRQAWVSLRVLSDLSMSGSYPASMGIT